MEELHWDFNHPGSTRRASGLSRMALSKSILFRPDWFSIVRGRRPRLQEQNHVYGFSKLEAGRVEAGTWKNCIAISTIPAQRARLQGCPVIVGVHKKKGTLMVPFVFMKRSVEPFSGICFTVFERK